jgi:predicted ATPase
MRAHLEEQAAAHPVLVCLDDAQWTCPATLAGLRTLSRALHHRPVAWVLTRSWNGRPDAENLFDTLEHDDAVRLDLAPLPDDEVAALLTDAFDAPPEPPLLALASEAAGNPSLLVELIGGLRDDHAVRCADGRAGLTSSGLPRRVRQVARIRLDRLSKPAQHLLMTVAVLGPSFRLEDAAAMLGESPAALLSVIEETMAAGITTAAENVFRFRQQLLRRAVRDMIPQAGRAALDRQYRHLLLSTQTADGRA